ncbi:unnamed protein product [Cuscuta campestris]|uniref:RRM domain-containing protein n=1 Tax=Cuscuta campestris TaxID=132261 RepID=A0A484M320_9ASTE|nr:unnamed protein product [Cuscuta campestris]
MATALHLRTPCLYVGDLHPDATERDLENAFSQVGPLDSVRLFRNPASRKSRCFAFVSFFCLRHACKALGMNHTNLRGKPMRIMWWQRDPLIIKSGIGNVFVKNLSSSVTSAQLERLFSGYGTILSCKVAQDENGKSKCFGFVQFDSQPCATSAITCLHGVVFQGKTLYVSSFMKKEERMATHEDNRFTYANLQNIDCNLTGDPSRERFSKYEQVPNAAIARDEEGNSRDSGFIRQNSHKDAKNAVEALTGKLNDLELHVRNLSVSVNERKLEEIFAVYGEVTSVKIIRRDGISKGCGFVCFSRAGDAKSSMDSLNGTTCYGKPMHVTLALSREPNKPMPIQHFNHYQSFEYQKTGRQLTYDSKKHSGELYEKSTPGDTLPAQKLGIQKQTKTFWKPKNKNMVEAGTQTERIMENMDGCWIWEANHSD